LEDRGIGDGEEEVIFVVPVVMAVVVARLVALESSLVLLGMVETSFLQVGGSGLAVNGVSCTVCWRAERGGVAKSLLIPGRDREDEGN